MTSTSNSLETVQDNVLLDIQGQDENFPLVNFREDSEREVEKRSIFNQMVDPIILLLNLFTLLDNLFRIIFLNSVILLEGRKVFEIIDIVRMIILPGIFFVLIGLFVYFRKNTLIVFHPLKYSNWVNFSIGSILVICLVILTILEGSVYFQVIITGFLYSIMVVYWNFHNLVKKSIKLYMSGVNWIFQFLIGITQIIAQIKVEPTISSKEYRYYINLVECILIVYLLQLGLHNLDNLISPGKNSTPN